jgi:hypothetical protein
LQETDDPEDQSNPSVDRYDGEQKDDVQIQMDDHSNMEYFHSSVRVVKVSLSDVEEHLSQTEGEDVE